MNYIIIWMACMGLASAAIGRSYGGDGLPLETTTSNLHEKLSGGLGKDDSSSSSSSSSSTSTTTESMKDPGLVQEIVSELPVTLPGILQELEAPKRRVITYDQRQEGQYNIRADLDNFMFLLIPAAATDNFSILDILGKSGTGLGSRRTAHSSLKSSNKKKYSPSNSGLKPDGGSLKYRQAMKNADYLPRPGDHMSPAGRVGEFIEGRTPYHVDISALHDGEGDVQSRLNPDRQVDVLPPSYPLAYQHLMKPFLEADSTIIQALPPAEMGSRPNSESVPNPGYYRLARYIRGDTYLDSNRLGGSSTSQQHHATGRRISQIPMYRADMAMGAGQLYPPIDIPHFNIPSTARSFDDSPSTTSEELESKQTLEGNGDLKYEDVFLPTIHIRPLEDDLELELHTADGLIDGEAKALLSDGIERCAPGKRRDSYGVCREIEGY
ncbi:uncharacterized protein LOC101895119 [Musca domestica]|uniref:Uncharacterized protein LOC101895119 n=1 Tax=Musca domestica TaxID=7370 RepID=A0ABM3VI91_MUSDO|nr:uncharacterized protein LOC101895119 [Musca domestica]